MAKGVLILLSVAAMPAGAQSPTNDLGVKQETQARGYWADPTTGLMWAGRDNGRDLNWHDAVKYCRDLRSAGYSDWRLPTLAELEGIYDHNANTPGLAGPGKGRAYTWHVKGNLFLTGVQWSTSQRMDDRGHPNGLAWYFDFNNGTQNDDDAGRFSARFANYGRRALCVRVPENNVSQFTGKERDAETGLDWFGSRYISSAQGRFTSPDKPFADQDPDEPQSWNLYSYIRNNPLKFVDETGREIVYANDRLRAISDQRRQESASYNANLQGYDGPGSARLTIQYGPTANDPDGSRTNGVFSAQIAPSVQNCSSATDCATIPARLSSGTITVNDSLQKNDNQTSDTLVHEVFHANDARTNPQRYTNEPIRDANRWIIPHDDRPVKQRAIADAQQSNRERQEYARQHKRQQQEQKQREREERERRKKEQQN